MASTVAFKLGAVDFGWATIALWRLHDNETIAIDICECELEFVGTSTVYDNWIKAKAAEHLEKFTLTAATINRRRGNLVAIQMQNRNHPTVVFGIEQLIKVEAG